MDYEEEQANEIIVLESIYGEEMSVITETPYEFTIDVKYSEFEGHSTTDPPSITLCCKYTEKYPEEVPIISVENPINLPESEAERLKEHLDELAEQSLGEVMVYSLVTAVQDWLNDYKDNIKKQADFEREEKARQEAAIEQKKFEGTLVNKDTFMKWKMEFDAERNAGKTVDTAEKVKKLTGRELFMKDNSMNESDLKFLEEDGEIVKINESLFENLENLDVNEE